MASSASAPFSLTPDTLIPELLGRYPQARAVLERYGPRGGAHGSGETLASFARAHGIDPRALLDELRHAVVQGATHPAHPAAAHPAGPAQAIYRRYFLGGIAVVLTAGAVWGAWLLWRIGLTGDFHAATIHEVNAHGHAQIFGWVGLFIMGFALQALPRMWRVALPAPRWALASFVAMVIGLAVRTVAMAAAGAPWAAPVAMIGGAVELAAIVTVVAILATAFARSDARLEPYIAFVLAALGWFVIQAAVSLWHTWATMTATSRDALLWQVATYQAPLRDMQIHGLALLMILGVSIRMLPAMFGVPRLGERRGWVALALLSVGIVGEIVVFIAYRWTGMHALAGGLLVAWALIAAGALLVALPWRLWRPLPTRDRSAKFVRVAYGWLFVSLAMLLLLPVYQWASGIAFSHAYYGAGRHAITVGFISLMIVGVSAKVVPTLTGRDPRALPALWGPFVLINVGCLLRVSTQTLTDWHSWFFGVVGISGTLEVIGLALWGAHLARLMFVFRSPLDPWRRRLHDAVQQSGGAPLHGGAVRPTSAEAGP
ncbi:MAG: NnrS family protein [Phycisphaeraceae bacterium]